MECLSRTMFHELRLSLEHVAASTSCPAILRTAIFKVLILEMVICIRDPPVFNLNQNPLYSDLLFGKDNFSCKKGMRLHHLIYFNFYHYKVRLG